MASPLDRKPLGKTKLSVPPIIFGTSGLGGMPGTYGYDVEGERGRETVRAILDGPVKFLDTSRAYGEGRSEERIGDVIRERGGLPEGAIIATKLDRDPVTKKFDANAARRSLELSLKTLGLDRVHILHLHDPEYQDDLSEVTGPGGANDELMKMKEEGFADAVGLAAGTVEVMMPMLRNWDFDVVLSHNRFTVVNQNAEEMIQLAISRGMAVFNAAPYGGGVLAKGTGNVQRYAYRGAKPAVMDALKQVEAIADKYGVPPGAVALQFSMREPRITATVCGVSKPERVQQTLEWAQWDIPAAVWDELKTVPRTADDPQKA